jgi:hypothetical protein
MRHRESFTLLETVIVMALLMALAVVLLAALDPLEQIYRTRDLSYLVSSKDIHSAITGSLIRKDIPWEEQIEAITLSSSVGQEIIKKLINDGELKTDAKWSGSRLLADIYLTAPQDGANFYLCYQPISKAHRQSSNNRYDKFGVIQQGCPASSCYTCIAGNVNMDLAVADAPETGSFSVPTPTSAVTSAPSPTRGPTLTPVPENPKCNNFDPEYPTFAHTCNYSDKWRMFGCTNYCVQDMGCGGGACRPDERRLEKHYSNPRPADISLCVMYWFFTREEYCISGREANCGYKSYRSSELDYRWGCINPRRPYEWITYQ